MTRQVSVIIPTIEGREDVLGKVIEAYRRYTPDLELIVIRNHESIGQAWNIGSAQATGRYLHFTTDDTEPVSGWFEAAQAVTARNLLPAARVIMLDGSLESCGSMGDGATFENECDDFTPCRNVQLMFCTRQQFEAIGEFAPKMHYYVDDDWTWRALVKGFMAVTCKGYTFIHHRSQVGRRQMQLKSMEHRAQWLARCAELKVQA
jgi:GT2 family glycosyltransferase